MDKWYVLSNVRPGRNSGSCLEEISREPLSTRGLKVYLISALAGEARVLEVERYAFLGPCEFRYGVLV
jgi:hypothetical protein